MLTAAPIPCDSPDLVAALAAENLPTDDLALPGRAFYALARDGATVAWAGREAVGTDAVLLRSLVVAAPLRRRGIATEALAWMIDAAAADGAREAFALTTNPAVVVLLERLGFARLARADAPAALAATRQFSALCPASAVVLRRDLASEAA